MPHPDSLLSLSVGRLQLQDALEVFQCLVKLVCVLVEVGAAQHSLNVGLVKFNGSSAVFYRFLFLIL